ncbi:MAG: ATP-binding protein [Pseudomonadota bacterium]
MTQPSHAAMAHASVARLYRQMVAPFAVVILICAAGFYWLTGYLISSLEEAANEATRKIVQSGLSQKLNSLADFALDNAHWQATFDHMVARYDPRWVAENPAATAQAIAGVDFAFFAPPDGTILIAQPSAFSLGDKQAALLAGLKAFAGRARALLPAKPSTYAGWLAIDGVAVGCAVSPIGGDDQAFWDTLAMDRASLLGMCYHLNAARLAALGEDFSIGDLRLARARQEAFYSLPLISYDNREIGALGWQNAAHAPGLAWPIRLAGLLLVILIIAGIARISNKTGALIDMVEDRERNLQRQQQSLLSLMRCPELTAGSLEASLQRITREVAHTLGLERVGIWEMRQDGDEITSLDQFVGSTNKHASGYVVKRSEYPDFFAALQQSDMLCVNDTKRDPRLGSMRPVAEQFKVGALLHVMVRMGARQTGILTCEHVGAARDWTVEEQSYVRSAANLVALVAALDGQKATAARLAAAKEEAEIAYRAKSNFLATMSHEIRTPLNGILGMTHAILQSTRDETVRRRLHTVLSSSESLLNLLNDVLDLSKMEAGRLEISPHDFSLGALCDEVLGFWQPLFAKKGLAFEVRLGGVGKAIFADRHRLRQVMFNLISNALKFTHEGAVSVGVELVEGLNGALMLACAVSDTGIGIDEATRQRLFESFYQGDSSVTRDYGGTGLGLAICQRLIEQMGGAIEVASTPGKGSVFSFTIPCRPAVEERQPSAAPPPKPACNAPALKLLVAEDNEINREVARLLLEGLGHDCHFVTNGAEALAAIEAQPFDLILMDIQMPVMDGLSATRAIRALEGKAGMTPIIALTANAMPGDREAYLAAGMQDYIAKPIEPEALAAVLDSFGVRPPWRETKAG